MRKVVVVVLVSSYSDDMIIMLPIMSPADMSVPALITYRLYSW